MFGIKELELKFESLGDLSFWIMSADQGDLSKYSKVFVEIPKLTEQDATCFNRSKDNINDTDWYYDFIREKLCFIENGLEYFMTWDESDEELHPRFEIL